MARLGSEHGGVLLPAAFTAVVALVFIVPLGLVGVQLAREAHGAADWVRNAQQNGIPEPDALHRLPWGQAEVDQWWQQNLADPGQARELVQRTTRGHVGDVSRMIGEQVAATHNPVRIHLAHLVLPVQGGRQRHPPTPPRRHPRFRPRRRAGGAADYRLCAWNGERPGSGGARRRSAARHRLCRRRVPHATVFGGGHGARGP